MKDSTESGVQKAEDEEKQNLVKELEILRELLMEEQVAHTAISTAYESLLADIIQTVRGLKANLAGSVVQI